MRLVYAVGFKILTTSKISIVEEKRKDLKSSKQKTVIVGIISRLNEINPSFYYLSTSEIAAEVKLYIETSGSLSIADKEVVSDLGRRDIQMLLSLH